MARWQPGQSGNPAGPTIHPLVRKVKERARLDAAEAYERVLKLLRTAEKDETVLSAAREILKMAGVNAEDKTPVQQPTNTAPRSMSPEDLEKGLGPTAVN